MSHQILLIDIECTCDEGDNQFLCDEIETIEIGCVVVQIAPLSLIFLDEIQLYIRPQIHVKLTPFCIELTGIKQAQVDNALPFAESLKELDTWITKQKISGWGSWGNFDRNQLISECKRLSLAFPLTDSPHFNIKQLFARKHRRRVGLGTAVKMTGLEFSGRHHSGTDDAKNIGRILQSDDILRKALFNKI